MLIYITTCVGRDFGSGENEDGSLSDERYVCGTFKNESDAMEHMQSTHDSLDHHHHALEVWDVDKNECVDSKEAWEIEILFENKGA